MYTADFWIQKLEDADRILLRNQQISQFNAQVVANRELGVVDLLQHPGTLSPECKLAMMKLRGWTDATLYLGCRKLDESYYDDLEAEMNIATGMDGLVRYGYTIKRASLRAFPTVDFVVDRLGERDIDQFQETALDPAEPLVLLHLSHSGNWWFVQCGNYRGWMGAEAIAVSPSKKEWLAYLSKDDFLLVVGSRVRLAMNPYSPDLTDLEFAMGAVLPIAKNHDEIISVDHQSVSGSYVISLPLRNENGELYITQALVPLSSPVVLGKYLPYTRSNIVRQAFRMLGERYGWGGLFGSRDCSAFIMDIYRSFGFRLPRDAGEQAEIPGTTVDFAGRSMVERKELLSALPSGAMLHFPGHVMLYVGQHDGKFFVIHAVSACGEGGRQNESGTRSRVPLNAITVHDLSLRRVNGLTLLESIAVAKIID